ncbi:hypothetical protein PMAA_055280 [Talaromyces marneffei ATCC 18224]|uniref:Uncharacterized protein n=2 Tax=Talaromyces marneffei TaxID=37727 RepID=B6QKV4_TALMQ|nr:hypothetical protein PMAA_055280 [Talaromyces marneffei ATCC 18224]
MAAIGQRYLQGITTISPQNVLNIPIDDLLLMVHMKDLNVSVGDCRYPANGELMKVVWETGLETDGAEERVLSASDWVRIE